MPALAAAGSRIVEHVLPLSGCRLRVIDLARGGRVGELYTPGGRQLDEAVLDAALPDENGPVGDIAGIAAGHVSGWFGRTGGLGRAWALAFGAGGRHERLDVRFAGRLSRRTVPVLSDQQGLWVAEVSGAYQAATILGSRAVSTFRLHHAAG
jgi:hypothetical protein